MPSKNDFLSTHVHRYAEDELINTRCVSSHTYVSYITTLKFYLLFLASSTGKHSSNLTVKNLTYESFRQFMIDSQSSKGWSPATWNLRLAGLRSFFEYMALSDPKYLDIYRKTKLIRVRQIPKSEPEYVTLEQFNNVIEFRPKKWTEQRDKAIMILFFQTGFRISELINIKETDLDWYNSKSLAITVTGKGRKKRTVPIVDKDTVEAIDYLIRNRSERFSSYLFTTRDGGKNSESNIRRIIKKYFKSAIANKNITPHSLRHSAAMHWIECGVDIFSVSGILGHERVTTTQRYASSSYGVKEREMKRASKVNAGYAKFQSPFASNDELIESLNIKILKARK